MDKVNLNELAALRLVLNFVSVTDLLTSAMDSFSENNDTKSKDNANICFEAINTFLK
jgi:hypothetical protein